MAASTCIAALAQTRARLFHTISSASLFASEGRGRSFLMTHLQALIVDRLTGVRGTRVLFRGLSFRVEAGQVLSLEGPNGAGKTSLLRMIAGLLSPASGRIGLASADAVVEGAEERARQIGCLGHHDAAKPQMSPREVLHFFARLYGSGGDGGAGP